MAVHVDKMVDECRRIANVLKMNPDDVIPWELIGQSLDSEAVSVKEVPVSQLLPESRGALKLLPASTVDEREFTTEELAALMGNLTYRQREILSARYGLGGYHALTLSETAKVFNASRERVRQIEMKAKRRLRRVIAKMPGLIAIKQWVATLPEDTDD